jgi:HSP20 family protein
MWRIKTLSPNPFLTPAPKASANVCWCPAADVYRTSAGWVVKYDLAGIRPEDIRLKQRGNLLELQGARRDWLLEQGCHYHSLEINYCSFERRIEFPINLEHARITTEYRDGMLLVRIQPQEERP